MDIENLRFPEYRYIEFAEGSTKNRNRVIEIADKRLTDIDTESYTSHFRFTKEFLEHVKKTKSVSNFNGSCYSSYLWVDIDKKPLPGETPIILDEVYTVYREALARALTAAQTLINRLLHNNGVDTDYLRCYFSGSKGFHIGIPMEAFNLEPGIDFHEKCKYLALTIAGDLEIDAALYDKTRLFRIPNTINSKSGLCKIELSASEILNCKDIQTIIDLAKNRRDFQTTRLDPDEIAGKLAGLMDDYNKQGQVKPIAAAVENIPQKKAAHDYAGILAGKLEGTSRTDNLTILAGHWYQIGILLDEAIIFGKSWDTINALGLDADPKYKGQYPNGKVAGTIEDVYKRNEEQEALDDDIILESISASDLLASNRKPAQMIIDRLIPTKGYSVIGSFTKEGKTTLATQGIMSILSGSDFLSFPFRNPVNKILYLFWEMDIDDLHDLLKVQVAGWGGTKPDLSKLILIDCHEISLETKQGKEKIGNLINEHQADLIVIDPLMLAVSGDICDLKTVKFTLRVLREIGKDKDLSWVLIHHYSKPNAFKREPIHAMYGSTGWANFCVSFMGLERYSERRSTDYKKISFKIRRGRIPDDLCLFLNPVTRLFEIVENPEDEIEAISPNRVRDIFQEQAAEKGYTEISHTLLRAWVEMVLGISESQAKRLIKEAVESKIIGKEPGKYGKYRIL